MITMKQSEVLEILKNHQDFSMRTELEREDKYIQDLVCKICQGSMLKILTPTPQFFNGLPKYWAKCVACGVEIEPYTGIQITLPDYKAFLE